MGAVGRRGRERLKELFNRGCIKAREYIKHTMVKNGRHRNQAEFEMYTSNRNDFIRTGREEQASYERNVV